MLVKQFRCPNCQTTLRPAKPVENGKKVKCTRCSQVFIVQVKERYSPPEDEEYELEVPSRRRDSAHQDLHRRKRGRKKARKKTRKNKSGLIIGLVGAGVVMLIALTVLIYHFATNDDSDTNRVAQNNPPGIPADLPPDDDDLPPFDKGGDPGLPPFDEGDDPGLPPDGPPFGPGGPVGPPFQPPKAVELKPEVLSKVKNATTFIRIVTPSGREASGSGFIAFDRHHVVTNAHVVAMMADDSKPPRELEIKLNSGQANEISFKGEVVVAVPVYDLAILRLHVPEKDISKLPEPLKVISALNLRETEPVYISGFPFGEDLGANVTISQSSVSALRRDGQGQLERVQINGGMHPGNSGGPVVNKNGDVVGVSVSIIEGTNINFAVPGDSVKKVVNGKIASCSYGQLRKVDGQWVIEVRMNLVNPLGKIKRIAIDHWIGNPGKGRPGAKTQPALRPGDGKRETVEVSFNGQHARTLLKLPAAPDGKVYYFQPMWVDGQSQSQWMSTGIIEPPIPIVRKPAHLMLRHYPGKQVVDLRSTNVFKLSTTLGKARSYYANMEAKIVEQTSRPDRLGTVRKQYIVGKMELGISLDRRAPPRDNLLKRAMQQLGFLSMSMLVDRDGRISDKRVRIGSQTYADYRDALDELGNQILHSFDLVAVPIPNRVVQPGEKWESQRMLPIDTVEEVAAGKVSMTYTYAGVQTRNGRQEAVILMKGDLNREMRGRDINLIGKADGKAYIDLSSGKIVRSEAKVQIQFSMKYEGESFKASGKLDVRLDRPLTPAPPGRQ